MARNRVIYQSEALFMNSSAALSGSYNQIERVQSANYSYTINRQDINQYGQLGLSFLVILRMDQEETFLLQRAQKERMPIYPLSLLLVLLESHPPAPPRLE